MKTSTVVSIFSGCGGFDLGFKQSGFDIVYACDWDASAVDCYARNLDPRVYRRDVTKKEFHSDIENIGTCDIVLGGFPCQGFSKAGPKNANDTRNALYAEMRLAIAHLRPHIFIAENVDGISQNFQGAYLDRIVSEFGDLGYHVDHRILDAVTFGIAQHRRRIFFVGTRKDSTAGHSFTWPAPTHHARHRNGESRVPDGPFLWETMAHKRPTRSDKPLTISDAIGDLCELDAGVPDHCVATWPRHYDSVFAAIKEGQKLCNVRHAATSVYTWGIPEVFGQVSERERFILETIAQHRRHKRYGNIPNGNPIPISEIERLSNLSDIELEVKTLLEKGYLKTCGDGFDLKGAMFCSGMFKRPKWNEPAPTVLTNFYNPRYFIHPLRNRPFTLRECARLQGFPDNFLFLNENVDLVSGYRLVGNAVPPPISRQFAAAVAAYLTPTTTRVSAVGI